MCGIAGIFHRDGCPASITTLTAMTDIIAHRGPDGEGHYCNGPIGLGHRRLSIIDLTDAARQPMETRDGKFILTYNGEIYNFKELKIDLSALGHRFNSTGDSEVLLHAFAEWGVDALLRFNGMFAFAIWDSKERQLTIARDRFGVKPVYYAEIDGTVLFASEIKAFRAFPASCRASTPRGSRSISHFRIFLLIARCSRRQDFFRLAATFKSNSAIRLPLCRSATGISGLKSLRGRSTRLRRSKSSIVSFAKQLIVNS